MIPRHRLQGRGRFAAVRAHGTRASAGPVRLTVAGNGLAVARVGFALVGMRSAVARNRLRRRLREAIRPQLDRLAGQDTVVGAGQEAAALPFGDLREALVAAIERALERVEGARARSTSDNGAMASPTTRP